MPRIDHSGTLGAATHGTPSRRRFIAAAASTALATACASDTVAVDSDDTVPAVLARIDSPQTALDTDPFTLGVASGDPDPHSVILWTRLAVDPLAGGGMGDAEIDVVWEVANDDGFTDLVATGVQQAVPAFAHSLHVEAGGLDPNRWYFYRFRSGEFESPIGRTRTAPIPNTPVSELRLAVASCQNWQSGHFNAYDHLVADDPDLVVFVGDYIYEYGDSGNEVRLHGTHEAQTLDEYRNRYALYRSDPRLQAAHAACPWLVTWDDHEVANNYAGTDDENGSSKANFLQRRAAAYLAYYEHMPLRTSAPGREEFQIYRNVEWGNLASFSMLDTRQYRWDQACPTPIGVTPMCEEMRDGTRAMIGNDQLTWLTNTLRDSRSRWNVIAQQVLMTPTAVGSGKDALVNNDQWDGYPAERLRVTDAIDASQVTNPIVLTGDIHLALVGEVPLDATRRDSPSVATEFVCNAVTSPFPASLRPVLSQTIGRAAGVKYMNADERGYLFCTVDKDEWRTEFRLLESVDTDGSELVEGETWVVANGSVGASPAEDT
jgi:alkaline phosphatase D